MRTSHWFHALVGRHHHVARRANVTFFACTLFMLVILAACSRSDAPPPPETLPTVPVHVVTVDASTHQASEEVVGTVRAKLRASLEAKVSGRIEQFHAVPGQAVQPGDVLVELDAREVRARVDQALALHHQAERDLVRFKALLEQEAVTRAEFDAAQARYIVADAAAIEARTLLDHTRIIAPFRGIITRKLADVGDLAHPGRPLLELEDPSHLRFEAHVPESLFTRIERDAQCAVRVTALNLELKGTVSEIAPVADPGSRTSLVKLDLPTTPGLRSGQFGRLLVPTADRAALRVPSTAVIQRGQLELLFVVQDNRAQLRIVKTGKRWADEVELVSGIRTGETIVATGAAPLRDGQSVTIIP
jgi:RND family efflux transporter MFP subunit